MIMNHLFKILKVDFERLADRKGMLGFLKYYLFHRGFKAVVYFRIANWLYKKKIRIMPDLIVAHSLSKTGADIPYTVKIGPGLALLHPVGVVIGARCIIGENCTILQGVTLGSKWSKIGIIDFPKIGNNVVLGSGSKILGSIKIDDNVTVGANSVVLTNVPIGCIALGVPARIMNKQNN
jgi:serine O-acetyltransferase